MSTARIVSLATGVPEGRYSQGDIFEAFAAFQQVPDRRIRAMRMIFDRAGVGFRHLVVGDGYFDRNRTTKERNDLYMEEAVPLAAKTICKGLNEAGYAPGDVDDLIVVSCTGFSIPGLDLHLAGRLKMRSDLRRTCVLGMGCYGAFPTLNRAFDTARADAKRLTLIASVELCSLHMQTDDSAENIVSSALFSDGAAMVLIGHDTDAPHRWPQIIDTATACDYTTLDHMSFTVTDHGFRMYLSSYVPDILSSQVKGFVDALLAKNNLTRSDVRFWGIHPGSSKIVDYVQHQLELTDAQVEDSHAVLHDYGNMSSATILFVLDRITRCQQPAPGEYGVLMAFGPGLTIEGMLVRW
ncbi:MAG: type III polyketide synthase [bacterium]|nr:type III polyketide synthase [bacterium]